MSRIVKSNRVQFSDDSYVLKEPRPISVMKPKMKQTALSTDGEENSVPEAVEISQEAHDADAYTQEIMQEAKRQADMILMDAAQRAQAEHTRVMLQARQEIEILKQDAIKDGFAQGAQTQVEAVQQCIVDLEQTVCALEGGQAGFVADYEANLKWLALELASKILNKRLADDDADMAELVKGAVSNVSGAKWISIEISSQMPRLLDTLTQTLQHAQNNKTEVRPVNAQVGTCIIDTPHGVIDASIYTQLENLKQYFEENP